VSVSSFNSTIRRAQVPLQIYRRVEIKFVFFFVSLWSCVLQAVINIDSLMRPVCAINCTVDCRTCCSHVQQSSIDRQLFVNNRDLCLPRLHSTPQLGGSGWNIATTFDVEKLEWCGYPTVKTFEDIFIRFDRIHERDGRTDEQTNRHRMTA